jgi:hypothetical protein
MSDSYCIELISDTFSINEKKLSDYPVNLSNFYWDMKSLFITGNTELNTTWPENELLDEKDFNLINQFMFLQSFFSTCLYSFQEDDRAKEVSHSAAFLVSQLGFDPNFTFLKFLKYEKFWQNLLESENLIPKKGLNKSFFLLLGSLCLLVYFAFLLFKFIFSCFLG